LPTYGDTKPLASRREKQACKHPHLVSCSFHGFNSLKCTHANYAAMLPNRKRGIYRGTQNGSIQIGSFT
jgi:hypothetical protein